MTEMECEKWDNTFDSTLFDLPLEDVLITHVAKYLSLQDIFAFRCCSRYSKDVGNAMIASLKEVYILTHLKTWKELTIRVLFQHCRRVRKMVLIDNDAYSVNFDWINDEIIAEMLSNNCLLEEFTIDIRSPRVNLTSKAFIPLATSCKKLVKITLWGKFRVDGFLPFLKILNQHNNNLLEADFIWAVNLPNDAIEDFFRKQPRLQCIRLPYMSEVYFYNIINTIAEHCKDLTVLEFSSYPIGYDSILKKILKKHPELKSILPIRPHIEDFATGWL